MKQKLLVKLFGSKSDRDYKKNLPVIEEVNRIAETFQGFAEPEFAAGNLGPDQLRAVFQDLWVRYRQVWPKHWRAAGNRSPEFPRDG